MTPETRRLRQGACLLGLFGLAMLAGSAEAQDRTIPYHKAEIGFHGGYMWSFSRDVYLQTTTGQADFDDAGFWGVTVDVNVDRARQVTLLYQREETTLTFRPVGLPKYDVTDMSLEYFQIGGLAGTPKGNVLPYGMFTVGATRAAVKDGDDVWRFSFVFGAGAKAYFGERLGVRLQGQIPFTFIDGSGSIACGSFGCVTTIGGTGMGQLNVGGGLFVNF